MTVGLVLSLIFLALQLAGQIDWEWWQIAMPSLIELGVGLIVWLVIMALGLSIAAGRK